MRALRVLAAAMVVSGLAGCAATGGDPTASRLSAEQTHGQSGYYDDVDWEKMNRITHEAEMRGHKIVWVNPPQKSLAQRAKEASSR